jgi:hypothetical protein
VLNGEVKTFIFHKIILKKVFFVKNYFNNLMLIIKFQQIDGHYEGAQCSSIIFGTYSK